MKKIFQIRNVLKNSKKKIFHVNVDIDDAAAAADDDYYYYIYLIIIL